jgi:hypothetical protein
MRIEPISAASLPKPGGLLSKMKMTNCRELFAEFPVDMIAARDAVPNSYDVRVYPNGMALLLLMVQECQSCTLDQLLVIRPMRMAHFWIELVGPEEVGPAVPGSIASLPTSYYYAMPHQLENPLGAFIFRMVGIDIQHVAQITIGGDPGKNRRGNILESQSSGCRCSIEDCTHIWESPQVLTGRRWFFREYGGLIKRRSVGRVVCRSSFLGEGEVTLKATEDSIVAQLGFGRTLHGVSKAVEMSCEANIWVTPL